MKCNDVKRPRPAVTLLETLVVLLIIAGLLALLLPALMRGRSADSDATCKNNLHQLSLAMTQLFLLRKKLPDPCPPGAVGGWEIAVLPFMEDRILADHLANNPSIGLPSIAETIRHRPLVMTCPVASIRDPEDSGIPFSHYAFFRVPRWFVIFDVPNNSTTPWVQSPELNPSSLPRGQGPHSGGYFQARGDGDVSLVRP